MVTENLMDSSDMEILSFRADNQLIVAQRLYKDAVYQFKVMASNVVGEVSTDFKEICKFKRNSNMCMLMTIL